MRSTGSAGPSLRLGHAVWGTPPRRHAGARVRVLVVGNFLGSSMGRWTYCESLADRLENNGWEVIRASSRTNRFIRVLNMLFTVLFRRGSYDVAYVSMYSGNAFVWAEIVAGALRVCRRPFVLTAHGGALPHFAQQNQRRVRRLLGISSAVVSPSHYLAEALAPYREHVSIIPNAIEVGKYQFRLRSPIRPRLMWIRAFHRIYDPVLAVKAIEELVSTIPDIRLVMIGPDKRDGAYEETRAYVLGSQLERFVELIPGVPKSKVPAWLERGDIFINTATIDNTPISLMEAMACGLCVISTDVGGIRYVVNEGVTGLLFPPGDPGALANSIRRLLGDPELAAELSAKGRSAVELLDWAAVLPQWESLLRAMADGRALKQSMHIGSSK